MNNKLWNKLVGIRNKRKHNKDLLNLSNLYANKETEMAKRAKVLSNDELVRAIKYCGGTRYALRNSCLIMMSFYGGLRVGEIAALTYNDVLDNEGYIKDEVYLKANQTKGNEGRTLYFSKKLQKALQAYVYAYPSKTEDRRDKLFFSQQKNGFNANTLTQWFHHFYKKVGIDGASSHSGRRSFVTTLADKGISVRVIAELVGHSNISTTQGYIDINDKMLKRAIELAI